MGEEIMGYEFSLELKWNGGKESESAPNFFEIRFAENKKLALRVESQLVAALYVEEGDEKCVLETFRDLYEDGIFKFDVVLTPLPYDVVEFVVHEMNSNRKYKGTIESVTFIDVYIPNCPMVFDVVAADSHYRLNTYSVLSLGGDLYD